MFGVAEGFANQVGFSLQGVGLLLEPNDTPDSAATVDAVRAVLAKHPITNKSKPEALGVIYEALLDAGTRRRGGIHYTPASLAARLVDLVLARWDDAVAAPRVLDPTMGGGAFLLAAARRLYRCGSAAGQPATVLGCLYGSDIDSVAVAVTQAALALWAIETGADPIAALGAELTTRDALLDQLPEVDCVIGNPPFQNQLKGSTVRARSRHDALRERYSEAVAPYADSAGLFLLAGLNTLVDGGAMLLIQPLSLLATRDAGEVRRRVLAGGALRGLWFSIDDQFAASVSVCAPLVLKGADSQAATGDIERWEGADVEPRAPVRRPARGGWGALVADLLGIPTVELETRRTIGDIAHVTAGFRDQFYGFAPHTRELDPVGPEDRAQPRIVTVGMIDPLHLRWGRSEFRYAKVKWRRPVIDIADVAADDSSLAKWAKDRLRPKVLVATQTRVVEAAVDVDGRWLPITPTISIEPTDDKMLWHLAAAVSAPAVSAHLLTERVGTALAIDALMVSAAAIAALPLPIEQTAWDEASIVAREAASAAADSDADAWEDAMGRLGRLMQTAYGIVDDDLSRWWNDRRPTWRD